MADETQTPGEVTGYSFITQYNVAARTLDHQYEYHGTPCRFSPSLMVADWAARMGCATSSSSILPRSTIAEPDMHTPSFEHIPDLRTRAAAALACTQFGAAHDILLANQEMYGVVSMNPAIVIALATVIAMNQASANLMVDGDLNAR
jgi:hypothetical protein